jgi:transcription elongation factor Elf1
MLNHPKTERAEVYRDYRMQKILRKFLSGEITGLEPVYDSKHGYKYPSVEAIIGDSEETKKLLTHLHEIGILERQVSEKIINCPQCNSANISTYYNCPYCNSFDIKKRSLIEHIQCGYIDTEDNFKNGEKLFCPRCDTELNKQDVNYRRAGIWCSCNNCSKNFDIPVPSHSCRVCGTKFSFDDAIYGDVYSYNLKDEVIKEIGEGFLLVTPIREFLQCRGFMVESPGFLKGKSGTSHMFDVVASLGDTDRTVLVIDIAASKYEPVSEQLIVAMFAKVYDASPSKACLIAIPKIRENGRKLAELYNIKLVEGENQNEAIRALQACITAGTIQVSK